MILRAILTDTAWSLVSREDGGAEVAVMWPWPGHCDQGEVSPLEGAVSLL